MPRNPTWVRDELILTLDLYFRVNPLHTSESNPQIQELSDLLNALPIHPLRPDGERFRNPNGVYMKLCNFLRFDPGYTGIWKEFAHYRDRLAATAFAIRRAHNTISTQQVEPEIPDTEEEFAEGVY